MVEGSHVPGPGTSAMHHRGDDVLGLGVAAAENLSLTLDPHGFDALHAENIARLFKKACPQKLHRPMRPPPTVLRPQFGRHRHRDLDLDDYGMWNPRASLAGSRNSALA